MNQIADDYEYLETVLVTFHKKFPIPGALDALTRVLEHHVMCVELIKNTVRTPYVPKEAPKNQN